MGWLEGIILFITGWIAHFVWEYLNKEDDDDEQGAGEQQRHTYGY